MTIEGRRIAILVEQDFEDIELVDPMKAFAKAGASVTLIGSGTKNVYTGKKGQAKVKVDTTIDRVSVDDFDALFIPGGYAPDNMRLSQAMVDFVRVFHDSGKLVTAICHGPQMLISAGIVKGHRVTSWPSVSIDLKNAGAEWVDQAVVKDLNLITSRKPADIPQFIRAVIEALEKQPAIA
jgi:protease I